MSAPGRLGEVANGRIGAFQLANCGFGGQPGSEKCDWLDWVGCRPSGFWKAVVGPKVGCREFPTGSSRPSVAGSYI